MTKKRAINVDWQTKKLGEVCDFQRGLTYSKKDEVEFSGNVILRANNIDLDTNALDFSELKYIRDDIRIPSDKKVNKGSIIICTASGSKAHLGKVALIDQDCGYAFGGFMGQISPKEDIDPKYLFYNLISNMYKDHINNLSDGVNINNLRFDALRDFEISLPPLSIQKRIVQVLDEVFEVAGKAKENAQKNLQNARELFESYLQSVFANPGEGWEEKNLGKIGQVTSSKRIYKREYVKDGIPFYRIKEVKELANGKKITTDLYISEGRYKEIRRIFGVPKKGDVLMTAVGTIGEIYVVENDDKFYFKDGNILWIKKSDSINSRLLKYILMSFVEKIKRLTAGAAYNALTIEKLEKYIIYVPPFAEQESIVKKLDELSEQTKKLEEIYKQKLADLEELKKSVLKKAFAGEL